MAKGVIFVTGANGHIGNHIVADLLAHGYSVKGSVRDLNDPNKTEHVYAHARKLNCLDRLELVQGDVLKADGWALELSNCDVLLHTATIYSTSDDAQLIIDTANEGTRNLFKAAKEAGIKRVVYTSSVAAVGSEPKGVVKDENNWQTNTELPYTVAKTESERIAWKLASELELDLRVINPSGVLGGDFIKPTPSVDFFEDALKGKWPMAPKFPLAFVHVKDVAKAHRLAFEVDNASGRFILAPHADTNIHELMKRLRELYPNSKAPKRAMPNWMIPVAIAQDWFMSLFGKDRTLTRSVVKGFLSGDSKYSSKKAENVLGLTDWEDFDTCIRDTAEMFL